MVSAVFNLEPVSSLPEIHGVGARLLPMAGYPFALDVRIAYQLDRHGLSVTTTAINIGAGACPYAWPWNVLGWPAINVPAGFTRVGLPVGAQLLGPANSEARLISLAATSCSSASLSG